MACLRETNRQSQDVCIIVALEINNQARKVPAVLMNIRDLSGVGDIIRMPHRERFGFKQRGYPQEPYRDGTMPGTPSLSKPSSCTDMSALFFWISPKGLSSAQDLCVLCQHNILYHVRVFTHWPIDLQMHMLVVNMVVNMSSELHFCRNAA